MVRSLFSSPKARIVVLVVAILSIAAGGIFYAISNARLHDYYLSALQDAHIAENISVDGKEYSVVGTIPESLDTDTLSMLYAVVSIRRQPLFSLEGTDADAFSSALRQLQTAVQRAASSSTSTLEALFPFSFLESVKHLQVARDQFLRVRDIQTLDEYFNAEQQALNAYGRALRDQTRRVKKEVPEDYQGTVFLGTLTKASLLTGLDQLAREFTVLEARQHARMKCVRGSSMYCEDTQLSLLPSDPLEPAALSPKAQRTATRVAEAYRRTMRNGNPVLASSDMVVLDHSFCAPKQIDIAIFGNPEGTETALLYLSDVLYFKSTPKHRYTGENALLLSEMRKNGFDFLLRNPSAFYVCPFIDADVGKVDALLAIRAFAEAHPQLAPTQRARIVNMKWVKESDVYAYLSEILKPEQLEAVSLDDHHLAEALAVAYRTNSGDFDRVLNSIASWYTTAAEFQAMGMKLDMTDATLLPNHVGLFPLLFTGNGSVDSGAVNPYAEGGQSSWMAVTRWSEDVPPISDARIQKAIQTHVNFHHP